MAHRRNSQVSSPGLLKKVSSVSSASTTAAQKSRITTSSTRSKGSRGKQKTLGEAYESVENNPIVKAIFDAIALNEDHTGDLVSVNLIWGTLPKFKVALDEGFLIEILDLLVEIGLLGRKASRMRRAYYSLGALDKMARM